MAASAAVNAIKRGCDMLHEGRAQLASFKAGAEQAVGDAKALYKDITGFWGWLKGLLGIAPKTKPIPEAAKVAATETTGIAPSQTRQKAAPLDYDEQQILIIHEVAEQLGKFFDLRQTITNHYKDLEEASMHVYEVDQNHAKKAIERVEVELQLENLTTKIRETMVYAPPELKDLYSRFLTMYGRIKEEQEFAREEQVRNARFKRWRQDQIRNSRIDRGLATLVAVLLTLWLWAVLGTLYWQLRMPTDF